VAAVFGTKVLGLRALLEATTEDPLQLAVHVLLRRGRFGNEGQADYAMANEVLAKVAAAEARRRGAGLQRAVTALGAVGRRHGRGGAARALRVEGGSP
jgi:hypothetical protein